MSNSITKTLQKINIDLKGQPCLIFSILLLILNTFIIFKIIQANNFNQSLEINYSKACLLELGGEVLPLGKDLGWANNFIYASKQGKKYYFYNCRSTLQEQNKIYFKDELSAQNAGYVLAKGCQ